MNDVVEQKVTEQPAPEPQGNVPSKDSDKIQIVYILYLVGLVIGITGIVGVIMAYIYKGDAPEWEQSHYRFQIRTFWIGLLFMVLGAILALVVVGYLIFLFWMVWLIIRCVKGMKYYNNKEAVPEPGTWMF
ncbi:membrane protein [Bacterioplanes sanyensis]|jgi:uncharacterized membrane protein|uniref:DUF4870 family protein n=1 Tax=Bacterioplanes sanyensis TaxID=1249553 RepID=UPI0019B990B3|nr:hypothetical protein [Bacterioplanes sanyensis]GGY54740.1 membrane protein [Bacterioplanes sanyensis]